MLSSLPRWRKKKPRKLPGFRSSRAFLAYSFISHRIASRSYVPLPLGLNSGPKAPALYRNRIPIGSIFDTSLLLLTQLPVASWSGNIEDWLVLVKRNLSQKQIWWPCTHAIRGPWIRRTGNNWWWWPTTEVPFLTHVDSFAMEGSTIDLEKVITKTSNVPRGHRATRYLQRKRDAVKGSESICCLPRWFNNCFDENTLTVLGKGASAFDTYAKTHYNLYKKGDSCHKTSRIGVVLCAKKHIANP